MMIKVFIVGSKWYIFNKLEDGNFNMSTFDDDDDADNPFEIWWEDFCDVEVAGAGC